MEQHANDGIVRGAGIGFGIFGREVGVEVAE